MYDVKTTKFRQLQRPLHEQLQRSSLPFVLSSDANITLIVLPVITIRDQKDFMSCLAE